MIKNIHYKIRIAIICILLIELTYFLFCVIFYVHIRPKYRSFWAVFYREPPSNIKVTKKNRATDQTPSAHASTVTDRSTTEPLKASDAANMWSAKKDTNTCTWTINSTEKTNVDLEFNSFETKRQAFLNYGLDTIVHCLLTPVFLSALISFLSVRLKIEIVSHNNAWLLQSQGLCSYGYKLIIPLLNSVYYIIHIIFCITPLKLQFLNPMVDDGYKMRRLLPLISIILIFIAWVIHLFRDLSYHWDIIDYGTIALCRPSHGIGLNVKFMYYIVAQFYFCSLLTLLTVLVPLCKQKTMLKKLPNHHDVTQLINKINSISKRVCVTTLTVILINVMINVLYWIVEWSNPYQPYLSVAQYVLYTHCYLLMQCIWKDWKMRLCPLCYYEKNAPTKEKEEDAELTSTLSRQKNDCSSFDVYKS